jgi:hypothetical protein
MKHIRFTKKFALEPQNEPFLDGIMLGRVYKAHPTNREMCNYDYRVEVDGTFVVSTCMPGSCHVFRGIVPANATEVEVVS